MTGRGRAAVSTMDEPAGPPSGVRRRYERSDATVALLVTAARERFAREGYGPASLADIVERAGVTKGALYHHFHGKRDLFRAVYEGERQRLVEVVRRAYGGVGEPWDAFHAGIAAFLQALLNPQAQRILLVDAPVALGVRALWEDTSPAGFVSQIQQGLERAAAAGAILARPSDPLTYLINGAVCAAAQMIAHSDRPHETLREVLSQLRTMLDATVARAGGPRGPGPGNSGEPGSGAAAPCGVNPARQVRRDPP